MGGEADVVVGDADVVVGDADVVVGEADVVVGDAVVEPVGGETVAVGVGKVDMV